MLKISAKIMMPFSDQKYHSRKFLQEFQKIIKLVGNLQLRVIGGSQQFL